jgi:hypothetical protein
VVRRHDVEGRRASLLGQVGVIDRLRDPFADDRRDNWADVLDRIGGYPRDFGTLACRE